ncbi:hypothetical protein CRUP_003686, partial [Coryphaenoides rupestris]
MEDDPIEREQSDDDDADDNGRASSSSVVVVGNGGGGSDGGGGALLLVVNQSRVRPPLSVVLATVLYCAELVSAFVLCAAYHRTHDSIWMGFTVAFAVVPAVLIQLALTFFHRDLGRDRPLVLLLHLLLLGPVI